MVANIPGSSVAKLERQYAFCTSQIWRKLRQKYFGQWSRERRMHQVPTREKAHVVVESF
jgi:hypothetical protein